MTLTTTVDSREMCSRRRIVEVIGDTGNHYTLRFEPDTGDVPTCSCPGYYHRKHCKHQARAVAMRCAWSADGSHEPQKVAGQCPKCGAETLTFDPRHIGGLPADAGVRDDIIVITLSRRARVLVINI